jgi:F-type H+-transporting ATPase subunit a
LWSRFTLKNYPNGVAAYCVRSIFRTFLNLTNQTLGFFSFNHFAFVTTIFIFIFACNVINVFIPWVEEPTSDLNTTLALGITAFIYIQCAGIRAHGWRGYIKEYITPFFMLPLHITGKLATIISISFRLFGNIFGGTIITQIYNSLKMGSVVFELGLLPFNLVVACIFGLFEGFIQAFVFFMLTITYLAVGIQSDEPEEHFS